MREDIDVYRKLVSYLLVFLEIVFALIGVYTKSEIVIITASIAAVIIFVTYTGWGIIESVIFKHTNIIQVIGNYEVSGDRTTAVFRRGNRYVSVSVSKVDKITEVGTDERRFESIIERIDIPFRLIMQIEKLMTGNITEKMETRKHMKEIALSRISVGTTKNALKKHRIKSEIAYLEHNIAEIKSGGIPLRLSYYVMCSATSIDRYSAEKQSILNMNKIITEFDSAFGTRSRLLYGNDLVDILRLEPVIA